MYIVNAAKFCGEGGVKRRLEKGPQLSVSIHSAKGSLYRPRV